LSLTGAVRRILGRGFGSSDPALERADGVTRWGAARALLDLGKPGLDRVAGVLTPGSLAREAQARADHTAKQARAEKRSKTSAP
jgi:hypothetical protein